MPTTHLCRSTALLLLASLLNPASADVINVPADQPTIQSALDIALEGDEIIVSPGTYNEALVLPEAYTITLRSSDGPKSTVIDASNLPNGPVSVMRIGGPIIPAGGQYLVEGFTITGGTGYLDPFFEVSSGGGVYILTPADVVIRNCIIEYNQAGSGGGIYSGQIGALTTVENSIIRNNIANQEDVDFIAPGRGGGIAVGFSPNLTVDGCTFENNHAPNGTGGAIDGGGQFLQISNSVFENNSSNQSGGAISSGFDSNLSVSKCVFRNNSTTGTSPAMGGYGGGAIGIVGGSSNRVSQSMFYGNHTSGFNTTGGAVSNRGPSGLLIDGCIFADNNSMYAGGALGLNGSELILNSTFTNNTAIFGQAIFADDFSFEARIDNSVIWGNGAGAPVFDASNNSIVINYSIVEGGWNGFGNENINANPMFVDAPNQNFSLMPGSPANDSGDVYAFINVLPTADTDIAGNPRLNDDPSVPATGVSLLGQAIDRGAHEFLPTSAPACAADLNNDGVLNFFDVSLFLAAYSSGCP